MGKYYGIDLGTTYSCIAVVDGDAETPNPEVIMNQKTQKFVVPSVVRITDKLDENGENVVQVGDQAKNNFGADPENTVAFIKRSMSDPNYKRAIRGKDYTPEQISALILKHLVNTANEQRRQVEENAEPIYDVVITKPAYFAELETRRTMEAGKLAGLNVMRLINEPTAAALSYGQRQPDDKTLLVYDLGGGTFDVTIMRFQDKVANVLSTDGDKQLGGYNWDMALVNYVLSKVDGKFEELSLSDQNRILKTAEEVKKQLSDLEEYLFAFNYKGMQEVNVTQEDFDECTKVLLGKTSRMVKEALKKANLQEDSIDEVLLIGGSTHMPQVRKLIDELFPNSEVKDEVNPERAVALGAAVLAWQESQGGRTTKNPGPTIDKDKNPYSYGVQAYNTSGKLKIFNLIKAQENLEIERTDEAFYTSEEGQTHIRLHFYQAKSTDYEMELSLGDEIYAEGNEGGLHPEKQDVSWGVPAPKGSPVVYRVKRDKNGIVKVFVECCGAKGEFKLGMPASKSSDVSRR